MNNYTQSYHKKAGRDGYRYPRKKVRSVCLSDRMIEKLDELCKDGWVDSISTGVRNAVVDYLKSFGKIPRDYKDEYGEE